MTPSSIILFLCFAQIWARSHNVPRIVEGVVVSNGEYPFAAAIYYIIDDGTYLCGGSILTDRWILTAAQCLRGASEIYITMGVTNLEEASTSRIILKSTDYVIHPENDPDTMDNDIGLIFLPESISFNERIQPIKLPTETLGPYEDTLALGWGATGDGTSASLNQLYYVILTTISNAICRRTYGEFVKDNMVCAVGEEIHGICEGDSGGPLVKITSSGDIVQVGVASFYSAAGCETAHPSGFTRLFEYVDWIKNVTGIIDDPEEPTDEPTLEPTEESTNEPTEAPTNEPTVNTTEKPTEDVTNEPTLEPTEESSNEPTNAPSEKPTEQPTEDPPVQPPENNSSPVIVVNVISAIISIFIMLLRNII